MKKNLATLVLIFWCSQAAANWSDYTFLGTISNVVFSYRVYNPSQISQGSKVQFKALNLNNMRSRVQISDVTFNCYDGSSEVGPLLRERLTGGEEHLFQAQENVCQERGGFESLSVSLDARVRR